VIAIVWEFQVAVGTQEDFEKFYGVDGPWADLARRDRSYLGASFLRDLGDPLRYVLTEYWSESVVYERHRHQHKTDLLLLEEKRNALVTSATPLGVFQALDVPERTGATWSTRTR
jgi:hypothetical protein